MQKVICNEQFGNNLKKIRTKCGFTQEEVSTKMQLLGSKMSRATYSNIENGYRNIFIEDLVKLKTVFHVSFEELFYNIK